jgi:molybdopterin/thiamine biosynthesis adenylyltransferase
MLLSRTLHLTDPKSKNILFLVDGDRVEPGNLDRQYYGKRSIGKFKVEALTRQLVDQGVPAGNLQYCTAFVCGDREQWPSGLSDALTLSDAVICAVDNHACRRTLLDFCVSEGKVFISAANELTDSEAFWWHRGMPADHHPYRRWPELLTDNTNDPTKPGCVGAEAGEAAGQLAHANFLAAGMAAHWLNFLQGDGWPLYGGRLNRTWQLPGTAAVFLTHRASNSRFTTQVIV